MICVFAVNITFSQKPEKQITLTDSIKSQINWLTNDRLSNFSHYISTITSDKVTTDARDMAMDIALHLFISDTNTIEVSAKNMVHRYTIWKYLNKLKLSFTSKNQIIAFTDIYVTDGFTIGVDGKWHGKAKFIEHFKSFKNDILEYEDVSNMEVEIALFSYNKSIYPGVTTRALDVKLGDIKIDGTFPAVSKDKKMR